MGLYKTELVRRRGPWRTASSLSWRPPNGWTGGTTDAYTAPPTTSHPLSTRAFTMTSAPPVRRRENQTPESPPNSGRFN